MALTAARARIVAFSSDLPGDREACCGPHGCGAEEHWPASDADPGVSRDGSVPGRGTTGGLVIPWGDEPGGHVLPMIVGVRQLVDAARAAHIIINTTGFVTGPGRVLKSYKIEAVRPDVIVALENGRELRTLLQAYRHYRILRLPARAYATSKTFEQRRAARERAFGAISPQPPRSNWRCAR